MKHSEPEYSLAWAFVLLVVALAIWAGFGCTLHVHLMGKYTVQGERVEADLPDLTSANIGTNGEITYGVPQ